MLRLVVMALIFVSVSRWTYSEVQLLAPSVIPLLDCVAEITTIPTHDKWPKDSMRKMREIFDNSTQKLISTSNEWLKERRKDNVVSKNTDPHIVRF